MNDLRELNLNTGRIYGLSCQLGQLQEEAAELIQAVSKYKRARGDGQPVHYGKLVDPEAHTRECLIEEMVDTSIMLEQIFDLLGVDRADYYRVYEEKVQRTLNRIDVQNREG